MNRWYALRCAGCWELLRSRSLDRLGRLVRAHRCPDEGEGTL